MPLKSLSLLAFMLGCCWPFMLAAQTDNEAPPLPQPLSLDYALSLAGNDHPDLVLVRQRLLESQAEQRLAASVAGFSLGVDGQARWVRPPPRFDDSVRGDHRVRLYLRKRLYDFGQNESEQQAASAETKARQWLLQSERQQRRLQIMRAFFDVILADLSYTRDNEDMAVAYIRYDQSKDRNELGQLSDIDLLKAASDYQTTRKIRFASQGRQQQTRSRLALLLNRPGQLPDELAMPRLPANQRALPELQPLLNQAQANNPVIQAIQDQVAAAQQRLQSARAGRRPVIEGEAEVAAYSRVFGFSDPWRASINVDIPLYRGGEISARVARQQAELTRLQAELAGQQYQLEQLVREHWLKLESLLIERDERRALSEYRELYLDRARTIYEQEVETDLGDAMVEFSEASLLTAKTEFELAFTWASLEALIGQPWGEN